MRIHTLGSVAGLVAIAALSACVIPDDYEATIALAENSVEIQFAGDLVNVPIQGEYKSGKPAEHDELRDAVEEYMAAVIDEGGFTNVSKKYVDGGRMHVEFEVNATDRIARSRYEGYSPIPGLEIRQKMIDAGMVYEFRFEGADAEVVSELAAIGVDVSGNVCIETELELAGRSPGDWVKETPGGWFSSTSYCVDTTLTPREQKRIAFFKSGGNS